MRANVQVRRFEPSDLERVLAIERDSFASEAWDQKLFDAYHRSCGELFLVAEVGRRVAGYALSCARLRDAELVSIAVDPDRRRHRVGRALLDVTRRKLREQSIKTWWLMVDTANEAAIAFYETYGFARKRRVKNYYRRGRDAWRMRLPIE